MSTSRIRKILRFFCCKAEVEIEIEPPLRTTTPISNSFIFYESQHQARLDAIGVKVNDIPEHFICSLTAQVMDKPVFTVVGNLHEETAIRAWLHHSGNKDPYSNDPLPSNQLTAAPDLEKAIEEYVCQEEEKYRAKMTKKTLESNSIISTSCKSSGSASEKSQHSTPTLT